MNPRTGRRRLLVAAGACVCAGVVLLGWVAWQLWGTSAVSRERHADVVAQLEDAWSDKSDGDKTSVMATEFGDATAIVRIPALGADYAVPVLEGTTDEVLASGFGHMGHAKPGGPGNYVIAGHRITHGEPLRRMPDLEPGDAVIVETRAATYTYVLLTGGDALTVQDDETWVTDTDPLRNPKAAAAMDLAGRTLDLRLENVPPEELDGETEDVDNEEMWIGPGLLTLITCADFTRSPDRLVAFAQLVDVKPRGAKG